MLSFWGKLGIRGTIEAKGVDSIFLEYITSAMMMNQSNYWGKIGLPGWIQLVILIQATILLSTISSAQDGAALENAKPKVIVMTDGEIDDHSSMIRFLLYTCDVDVQAIIETNSIFQKQGHSSEDWYEKQLAAYEEVYPNLIKHRSGYPTADELRNKSFIGDEDYDHLKNLKRWDQIPGGKVEYLPDDWPDTPGSDRIVEVLLQDDPAPVHLQAWGGGNTAARAFYKLKKDHPKEYQRAASMVVMYNIWYQDDAGNYIETHHPEVTMLYCGHFAGSWNYKSQPDTQDFITENVKTNHGALGALYPQTYISEGDSPAFFYTAGNGLRNYEHPGYGGWGGRFKKVEGFDRVYSDAEDAGGEKFQLKRWIDAVNADFEARMDWCVAANFADANHQPVAKVAGGLGRAAAAGEAVQLDASGSTDPDGDKLSFRWWHYHDVGSVEEKVTIENAQSATASFVMPDEPGKKLHVILEVTDNGTPALSSYQRIIVTSPLPGFGDSLLKNEPVWFASATARAIANNVIHYQSPHGGWPKSTNLSEGPELPGDIPPVGRGRANSLDNGATTTPMTFLAKVMHATGDKVYGDSFVRGLDYLFDAQYPTGGWPQFYPLREGYYSRITFNDGAMIRVMELLRDVAKGEAEYSFVDAGRRAKAAAAVEKGIDCILQSQIRQDGKLTVWCAQHDEITFAPAWARNYEIPSLSGSESVGITRFLMKIEKPSLEIFAAIEGAMEWFESAKITGLRYRRGKNADGERDGWVEPDPEASPIWARFYGLGTNRPLFVGRDKKIGYVYEDVERERRGGYSYYGAWPANLIEKDYPKWRERIGYAQLKEAASSSDASIASAVPRVIVSTDIGGTDFDDFQSMVHLFACADRFDIEGILSSPYGSGRKEHILKVIDAYESDYPNLKTYTARYPAPDRLRDLSKQGAIESAGLRGYDERSEGSDWIIECAKREDPRPLWILVWGGIDDLAQALHDDPSIKSKIRVYFIGGPNKKWSAPAYDYIAREHPDLWIIEANSTYRGWFVGGEQSGDWHNDKFVGKHVSGRGALGDFFSGISFGGKRRTTVKMGDTPSLVYPLSENAEDPSRDSWGGRFVRAWDRPRYTFDHAEKKAPTKDDKVEAFSVVEMIYHPISDAPAGAVASLQVDRQEFPGFADEAGVWHFLFSPKSAKSWSYKIKSTHPELDGKTGGFTSLWPAPEKADKPSTRYPNWWTDDPDPAVADGNHQGTKTVSKWRVDFLGDFAKRMMRCESPASK